MAKKRFYGVAGENGYGVYNNYEKVIKCQPYVRKFKVKGFDTFEHAKEFANDTYFRLQYGAQDFFHIDQISQLNWFYYSKRLMKPFTVGI